MNSEPSWDLYRSFAAVLREGSLSAAARVLGLAQPSVARHVEALERATGASLFVRTPRGLFPTDRAVAMRPLAERMEALAAALFRDAGAEPGGIAGTVRVTASEVVAAEHLPPLLVALRREHPRLAIELVASDAVDDLLQRRADIALRMVAPVQQALVARLLGRLTLGLFAHRDYLARRGVPDSLPALAGHDLIGMDTMSPLAEVALRALPGIGRGDFALRVDSTLAQLAAIRAGFGIGICQVRIAEREPALCRVLPDAFAMALPLWIAMHEDLRGNAGCRTVFDALAAGLSAVGTGAGEVAARDEMLPAS